MTNDKNRTGEIWKVKYFKKENWEYKPDPTINIDRTYVFKIIRSWKSKDPQINNFQYTGMILESSDVKGPIGMKCYLGYFFYDPTAIYEQILK